MNSLSIAMGLFIAVASADLSADQRLPREAISATGSGAGDFILVARQQAVDSNAAAAKVRAHTGGRVLGVRAADRNGRPAYQVKVLLSGGRVRAFWVDARTGQLLP
jgi:uncharacterized membrane protein YkoI